MLAYIQSGKKRLARDDESSETKAGFRVARAASTLRRDVTESIRQAITAGYYEPGQRLPERELCEMIGVSRTLVREALRQVESEGLIEVIPHKGPVVAIITREQALGVYQVREALEGLAARLFAKNATPEARQSLVAALDEVGSAETPLARLRAKNRFYEALVEGSGNEALGHALFNLNSRTMLLRSRSIQHPGRWEKSVTELRSMVDAACAGNEDRAEALAQEHVRNASTIALATF